VTVRLLRQRGRRNADLYRRPSAFRSCHVNGKVGQAFFFFFCCSFLFFFFSVLLLPLVLLLT
jgi:hypothetical protein